MRKDYLKYIMEGNDLENDFENDLTIREYLLITYKRIFREWGWKIWKFNEKYWEARWK